MRLIPSLTIFCYCAALAACNSPGPEYHFTADQLAWQPYQDGQVLRFGNSRTAAVRTYRVTQVYDVLVQQSGGWGLKPFPHQEPPSFQTITVLLQRTDSLGSEFEAFGLRFDFDHPSIVPGNELLVEAYLNWDTLLNTSAAAILPVDELNQGLPLDTTRYHGIRLLPTRTLGPATYAPVVQYILRGRPYPGNTNSITELYVTKVNGVVGFVQRNTLWYRIP